MLEAALIALICFFGVAKNVLQSAFAKKNVVNTIDGILFNGIVFIGGCVIMLPQLIGRSVSLMSILFGVLMGVVTLLFQLSYIKAMSTGPVSLTVLITGLGMFIPVVVSTLCFHESLGVFRAIGIAFTCVALFLNVQGNTKDRVSLVWLFFAILTSCMNGTSGAVQKTFGLYGNPEEVPVYVFFMYLTATLVSFVLYFTMRARGQKQTYQLKPIVWGHALLIGAILGLHQAVATYAAGIVDGTLLYPITNGGVTLMMTFAGVLLFKDKLSKRRKLGVVVGLTAIVLMSIAV